MTKRIVSQILLKNIGIRQGIIVLRTVDRKILIIQIISDYSLSIYHIDKLRNTNCKIVITTDLTNYINDFLKTIN